MPKEILLKKLSLGIHADEDKANDGYIADTQAIDIHGVGGGTASSAAHRPKSYQPSQRMVAEAESAAPNDITDLIEWVFPYNGKTYGLSNSSRLYEATTALGGTWGLKFATSSSTGGGGLMPFGANLYYGQNAVLGQYNGTASNHNFQTFSDTTAGPRPMDIIAGTLAIGNQRNIATLNSDETTFSATRLQLPIGYVIRSMETWNNFLAIAADFTPTGATNPISSRLFLWNGFSARFNDSLELPYTSAPNIITNDNILWIIGGDATSNMLIYAYNGSAIQRAFFIPDVVPRGIGSKTKFQGTVLFGTSGRTNSNHGGIYMIGGGKDDEPFALSAPFLLSPAAGITGTNAGGLYGEGNTVLAAWYDGTNYGIDKSSAAQFPTSGGVIYTLPMHMGEPTKNKMFYKIRIDLNDPGTSTGATFIVSYRLNLATAWTTLKTINQSDSSIKIDIPINRTGRRIEFRFQWTVSGSNNPLQLRSFTLYYDIAPGNF